MNEFFVPEVARRVAERTNYDIEWITAYGASVARLGDELEAIEMGLLDLGTTIIIFEPARLMLHTMMFRMPFAASDPIVVNRVAQQLYREFPEHAEKFQQYNQKLLTMAVCDPYGLFSRVPITSLRDVNGLRIGAGGANLHWINGSGAVPVNVSLNEVFTAVQTNVVQGTIQPTTSCFNLRVHEVAPYFLEANFAVMPFNSITINLDRWNSLPRAVQDILVEVGREQEDIQAQDMVKAYTTALEQMRAEGVTVTVLSREEQIRWAYSLPDIVFDMVTELNSRGYRGTQIARRYFELLEENGWPRVRNWRLE
jgi:TRAP-type C4-dicarboxylate transport system substrate-binding protein